MWGEFKEIYDRLSDEESKFIFINRLAYNMEHDYEYIYKIVTMRDKICEDDIYSLICDRDALKDQPLVVFGAGYFGWICRTVLEPLGFNIVGIADNSKNKIGAKLGKYHVYSPEEICADYPNALWLISVLRSEDQNSIFNQLLNLGVDEKKIYHYSPSGDIYGNQYFDVLQVRPKGVFVDAGSYNLSDAVKYSKEDPEFIKIVSFEPDKKNYEKCRERATHFEENRVEVLNYACGEHKETVSFLSSRGGSRISEAGESKIQIAPIDDFVDNPTFIKMDIEGAELSALHGAEKSIRKGTPDLAICVYHKDEDILEIPKYIMELNKNYHFWLRHYYYNDWETVLYASVR